MRNILRETEFQKVGKYKVDVANEQIKQYVL